MEKKFGFKKAKYGVVTLGEIMMRLSPPIHEMIYQSASFDRQIGGSELNVIVDLQALGVPGAIISQVPDNELGRYVKKVVRSYGVSDSYIYSDESEDKRLGVYYYEYGAYPRKPTVIYDRKGSSFTTLCSTKIEEEIFNETAIFHLSGITLGLTEKIREMSIDLIKKFKEKGAYISFDVNFRSAIWSEEKAKETITAILPYIDILFISEESLRKMFGKKGELGTIQKEFACEHDIALIATTKRTALSPKRHNFTSVIYEKSTGNYYEEKPYLDIEVVDRIGSGDAYLSGVLYGLLKYEDIKKSVEYGNATSVIKNTMTGDFSCADLKLIEKIISDHHSEGEVSELNR